MPAIFDHWNTCMLGPIGGQLYGEMYMDILASELESPVLGKVFVPDEPRL